MAPLGAKPGCPIAIVLQYLANRCLVPSHEAVIARKARRLLGDDPEAHRVMIATVMIAARVGEQSAVELKLV